jgi:hypothetical protein
MGKLVAISSQHKATVSRQVIAIHLLLEPVVGHLKVDYGHNPDAFSAICRMAARWEDRRVKGRLLNFDTERRRFV